MAKSPKNKTIVLTEEEKNYYSQKLLFQKDLFSLENIVNKTINADLFDVIDNLPDKFVDLMIIDPPYNLYKAFNTVKFSEMSIDNYSNWLDSWLKKLVRLLKDEASIYICGDWKTSTSIHLVGQKYFYVQNRITWERDKGRGALKNWKNNSEDIWFFTRSKKYTFNAEAVKHRRKVIAPYTDERKKPKDWEKTENGNFRLTYPSNLWNDITVPFWSMPENTEHPTQKPEKLIAKLILASSNEGDLVFDPFLGSGTTSVVAKKLNRRYLGVEKDFYFSCIAEKRLDLAENNKEIQGYLNGCFWERNTLNEILREKNEKNSNSTN